MSRSDDPPDAPAQLAALREAFGQLVAASVPDPDALERLADQACMLAQCADPQLAADAQRLELRIIGALLASRAMLLRQLAADLQRLAPMLPPAHPEYN
jgi:hypothetical protein